MDKRTVAFGTEFLDGWSFLPPNIMGKLSPFVNKFMNNPEANGFNYEKLQNNNLYSIRVNDDYRAIVAHHDSAYILLWIDKHDDAYKWANKRRVIINPSIGCVQIYKTEYVIENQPVHVKTLFSDVPDESLLKIGVLEEQIPFIRSFVSEDDLVKAELNFQPFVYENLFWLADGVSVDEILEAMNPNASYKTEKPDTEDFATALTKIESQQSFYIAENEDDLKRILAEPLAKWRIFLHPSQRRCVNQDFHGPARVLGSAGTGKTVVAMHRAKRLARDLIDKNSSGALNNEKVLFTTFTRNLAVDIEENLRKLCTTEEFNKIQVVNLDSWVHQFYSKAGLKYEIIYDDKLEDIWETAISKANGNRDVSFYREEWSRVVLANEAVTLQQYLNTPRIGRGVKLNKQDKADIWNVFEEYRNLLASQQQRDINLAMFECCQLLKQDKTLQLYPHIIVDEGQDLSPTAYRLIRAISGEKHDNDIFIVGDAHQRIYKNKAVLSRCGIDVRGRGATLRINYRTTEEIRKYAFAILKGISFDTLDDDTDVLDEKCQSVTHGKKPEIQHFKGSNEQLDYVVSKVKELSDKGVDLNDICLVTRTKKGVEDWCRNLSNNEIATFKVKREKADEAYKKGVRVATMHRVKGLEFKYVFVVDVNKDNIPQPIKETDDKIAMREALVAEKCLLYVALTRAREEVFITSYGTKSEFLE